jgi:hypothetical protein
LVFVLTPAKPPARLIGLRPLSGKSRIWYSNPASHSRIRPAFSPQTHSESSRTRGTSSPDRPGSFTGSRSSSIGYGGGAGPLRAQSVVGPL